LHTDAAFLTSLLDDPTDDATRLVYADWLEEQGEPVSAAKAEFLRLTVQLADPVQKKKSRKKRRERLQQLAAQLDTDWLAVVSRLAVENCRPKRKAGDSRRMRGLRFDFLCDRRWEELRPTDDRAIRSCDACQQNVHYCDTITEASRHADSGHCIAVDLGVIRREGDLDSMGMWLGRPSQSMLRQEEERMRPDPVSAERERRKQQNQGTREGT
jgi:uncharacterized protein (TIGR02996 family)